MGVLQGMSIRGKMLLGFVAVMVMADICGGLALVNLGRVYGEVQATAEQTLPQLRHASELQAAVNQLRIAQFQVMLTEEDADRQAAEAEVAKAVQAAQTAVQALKAGGLTHSEAVESGWQAYLQGNDKAMKLTGEFGLKAMGGAYRQQFDALSATLAQLMHDAGEQTQARVAASEATYTATRALLIGLLLAANIVGIATALVVSARIARPLAEAVEGARAVARGDLSHRLPPAGSDEVGRLMAALHDMQKGLRDLVGGVRGGVESINTASSEIAAGSMDLSNQTEQQAADLMQTSQTLTLLSDTVNRTSNAARQASEAAREASITARQGGEKTAEIVATMQRISASSSKITDIVGVIDGLAFQTNLLALNAAVEAARAGEQGRGFAVVAAEVRGLAQRSAQSAREIKTLISESGAVIEQGAALVQDAGQTMDAMVQRSDAAAQLIESIYSAQTQQSQELAGLETSVSRINEATHRNSALAEQSAAAAASLQDQGHRLGTAIAAFKA